MARISSTDRRSALIEAALRVIGRDGIAAATTRDCRRGRYVVGELSLRIPVS